MAIGSVTLEVDELRLTAPKSGLREGFSTGACAAAAAKAAALVLRKPSAFPQTVEIPFPDGTRDTLPIAWIRLTTRGVEAAVVKDAGDDPDITHGTTIIAQVEAAEDYQFVAGIGVGIVTRNGLQVPKGECAVNPVPRAMIRQALQEAGMTGARITLSIPGGEVLAQKTFNPRLGVEGGLSILGTAGRVRPFSLEAIAATIDLALNMVRQEGDSVVLVPGHMGKRAAHNHISCTDHQIVEVSNKWGHALSGCARLGFAHITLVGHPGKLAKLAQGHFDTHCDKSPSPLPWVLQQVMALGGPSLESPTVEGVFQALSPHMVHQLSQRLEGVLKRTVKKHFNLDVRVVLSGMDGQVYSSLATQTVTVAGCGPGGIDWVTPQVRQCALAAEVLAGAPRLLALFPESSAMRVEYNARLDTFLEALAPHLGHRRVVVLVTGDPGVASLATTLQKRFPHLSTKRLPGLSAIQVAFCETGLDWTHALVIHAHGKLPPWERAWDVHQGPFAILAGHPQAPSLARDLALRRGQSHLWACERLTLPDQQVRRIPLEALEATPIDPLSILILEGVSP